MMVQVPYHVLFITQNDKPKDAQGNWLFFIMLKKHGVQCTIIYAVIFDYEKILKYYYSLI